MIGRVFLAAAVVSLAVLVTPEMLIPGVNTADFIVMLAPLALVVIFATPSKTPAGGVSPDSTSPNVAPLAGPSSEVQR